MKKIILFLFLLVSNCFSQYNTQFLTQPSVGYQINLAHPDALDIVGMWLLNEGSGDKVYDLSLNSSNDGTLIDMVPDEWVLGRHGYALDFDGVDGHVKIPGSLFGGQRPMSVNAWIKRDAAGENDYILWRRGTPNSGWRVSINTADQIVFTFFGVAEVNSTGTITDTDWHSISVTVSSSGSVNFYIDGRDAGSTTIGAPLAGTFSAYIGARTGSVSDVPDGFADCLIDDVRFYNRTLTSQEVHSLYVNPYAIFEQPPGRILTATIRRKIIIF